MRSRLFSVLKCIGICLDWILCVMAQCLWLKTWRYTMPLMHTEEKEKHEKGASFFHCVCCDSVTRWTTQCMHTISLSETLSSFLSWCHTQISQYPQCVVQYQGINDIDGGAFYSGRGGSYIIAALSLIHHGREKSDLHFALVFQLLFSSLFYCQLMPANNSLCAQEILCGHLADTESGESFQIAWARWL